MGILVGNIPHEIRLDDFSRRSQMYMCIYVSIYVVRVRMVWGCARRARGQLRQKSPHTY